MRSIEVITNPPAKYDAEGGAILNIQTSTNPSIGYKGSLNATYAIGVVPKYLVGTSQYYKNNWLNFFASYNLSTKRDYKEDEGMIEFYEPNGSVNSLWLNNFKRNTRTLSHSFNSILDFTLSEKSELSLSANIQLTPKADSDISGLTEIFDAQNQPEFSYTTNSFLANNQDNILLDATFTTSLGENGASLIAAANYLSYEDGQVQDLRSDFFSSEGELDSQNLFKTDSEQNTQIYTGKIDLATPWGSSSLESGLKFSGIRSQSGMDFFDNNSSAPVFVGEFSDDFNYDENIYAAYASLSKDWETWSIKGGLRGEYTDVA
ncbi:outer membrane beta-barrel protein [Antarcticibacterium sp. 1MA-6-2]|uniref:outer membrane beta-barrel protein n=1 Tax=Antarcticibacterium sp. 1MA-6-2 TaxID=2908210 RepID=UPI002104BD4A|nr:outer membrane beta-barrel protein [Antarcticibacterium sp. 1MA-6-2]